MAILTCQCGAKVKVPEDAPGPFQCPRCRARLAVPAMASVGSGSASPGEAIGSCPTCQTPIRANEASISCPSCGQPHHRECWDEVGGCAIYGCQSAPQTEKQPDTAPITSAWGDNKACPMCGEQIKAIALKCRYCGANFDTVDPLSVHDLRGRAERDTAVKSAKTAVIALFIFSVMGMLAPLMLIISLIWVPKNKENLAKAGPGMLVLGYASIGLSVLYSIMMVAMIATGC